MNKKLLLFVVFLFLLFGACNKNLQNENIVALTINPESVLSGGQCKFIVNVDGASEKGYYYSFEINGGSIQGGDLQESYSGHLEAIYNAPENLSSNPKFYQIGVKVSSVDGSEIFGSDSKTLEIKSY